MVGYVFAILASVTVSLGVVLWIRKSYRDYCVRMDRLDALREIVSKNESAINGLLSRLDSDYGGGISGSISHNVRQKVEFSLNTIGTLPLEDQVRESKTLYDMTYETWERIRRNPDDILAVTSPLNSYCKEIARKKLNIIKKLAKEEET